MASAWGGSWGQSWGNSWGAIITAITKARISVSRTQKKKFTPDRRDEIARDDEEIIKFIEVFMSKV